MSRDSLRKIAAQFKEPADDEPASAAPEDAVDVTAEIDRRLAEARAGSTSDEPDPGQGRGERPAPSVKRPAPPPPPKPSGSPAPALRDTSPRQRVPVDIPVVFEPMRRDAKDRGITASSMVLSAIRIAGPALRERASREGIAPVPSDGFKRWTLLLSDDEIAELDDLTDALEAALGRRSRARTIALALQHA